MNKIAQPQTVHWVCHSPSPYNDYLFRTLEADPRFDLTVHYTAGETDSHPWQCELRRGYFSRVYKSRFGVDWHLIRTVVGGGKGVFVTGCWQDPTSQLILGTRMFRRLPYLTWVDTPLNEKRNPVKEFLRARFLKAVFSRAIAIMGTGRLALAALQRMGCPADKLVNLPYFIDTGQFTRVRRMTQGTPLVLGMCGCLNRRKGFDLALRALGFIARRELCFRLRIAGTGPEEQSLRSLAQELGIAERVEFVGWVEPHNLPAFYESIQVFLHPSHREPYGVVVLEAMAAGCVVIASDRTAAAWDRIRHAENGFLFDLHETDPTTLVDAIQLALNLSPKSIEVIGEEARRTALLWPAEVGVQILHSALAGQIPSYLQTRDRSPEGLL
jgi:glycosyltransferase involved in cell wall biosynthesis